MVSTISTSGVCYRDIVKSFVRVLASDTCGIRSLWDMRAGYFPQKGLTTNENIGLTSIRVESIGLVKVEQDILDFSKLLRLIEIKATKKIALFADNLCCWLIADQDSLNNIDVSSEYALKLRHDIKEQFVESGKTCKGAKEDGAKEEDSMDTELPVIGVRILILLHACHDSTTSLSTPLIMIVVSTRSSGVFCKFLVSRKGLLVS
ncbi:hypothetical protein Tco_0759194 [Tanacetum coccineum]